MEITIRESVLEDAQALTDIRNEALQLKLKHGDLGWEETPFTLEEVEAAINRGFMHSVMVDNKLAGQVVLIWEDKHVWGDKGLDNKAGYIHNLATGDAFRGQQLGKKIINWCANQTRENGKTLLRLDCPADNEKLCGYYERQGFQKIGLADSGFALYEREI